MSTPEWIMAVCLALFVLVRVAPALLRAVRDRGGDRDDP